MNIGIDARLLERRMTGIGRYLSDLVRALPSSDKENNYTLFSYGPLSGFDAPNMKNVSTNSFFSKGKFQKFFSPFWLNFVLPRFIKRERIDLFFSPNNLLPVTSSARKNIVAIIDVFPLLNEDFHSIVYRAYSGPALKRAAKKADHVITISECSKRDIVRLLHVPEEKISVTYLSAEKRFVPRDIAPDLRDRLRAKYDLPEQFILYVGVIEKRKNIDGIIRIADQLKEEGGPPIVFVGRPGYGGKEYIQEMSKRPYTQYCNFVTDEDLPYFYNLATAFIFPSWYEGFGLPPLEAMQSGLPVVVSNRASLPEVVGDAGIVLEPDDYEGFASELMSLARDKKKWAILREKGIVQAMRFSPEKIARETVRVFKNCVREVKGL